MSDSAEEISAGSAFSVEEVPTDHATTADGDSGTTPSTGNPETEPTTKKLSCYHKIGAKTPVTTRKPVMQT